LSAGACGAIYSHFSFCRRHISRLLKNLLPATLGQRRQGRKDAKDEGRGKKELLLDGFLLNKMRLEATR